MPSSTKLEFPPILPPGFHRMRLAEVRGQCVDAFPLSTTRDGIMRGLEFVVAELVRVRIKGDLWVNGSFATVKLDPDDVDLVLFVHTKRIRVFSAEQWLIFRWFISNLKATHHCDSYYSPRVARRDPDFADAKHQEADWRDWWGNARGISKGIIAVAINDAP